MRKESAVRPGAERRTRTLLTGLSLPTILFPTPSKGRGERQTLLPVHRPPLPLLQGSLDLLVLGTLASGAAHGYGVATLVRERSAGAIEIEDAALYQALHRLERRGLVSAEWGLSDNNRRARYYALTGDGRKRLREEAANWRRYAQAVSAVLEGA
jgi:PadR family transcriptional regulator PadR